jgi:hypothetical protein
MNIAAPGFAYSIQIQDPYGLASEQHKSLIENVSAAVGSWARHIAGNGLIQIALVIDDAPRASGASTTNVAIDALNNRTILRDSVPHKLITGIDLNGEAPDAVLTIGAKYLRQFVWLDPNPFKRENIVPMNKIDAVSLFMHEFGHALGMNGFADRGGQTTGIFASVYDTYVIHENGHAFFHGTAATRFYGGPVPLSDPVINQNTYHHYGHNTSDNLDNSLMQGNTFFRFGQRYNVGDLDLALMQDIGLHTINRTP